FVVIGGGISGLAIGALLTHIEKRVLLVEKNKQLGGRARVKEKLGFKLDNGLHLLKYGEKSPLIEIINQLNLDRSSSLSILPIRHYHLYVGDEVENIKPNFYERRKRKWWNRGWISVPRNMNEIRSHNYFTAWKLMKIFTTGFKYDYNKIKAQSLTEFIKNNNIENVAARYLKLAAGVLIHCPYSSAVSAGEVIRHIKWSSKQTVLFGYPKSGWSSIIDIFVDEIKKTGEIRLDSEVRNFLFEDNEIVGIQTDKEKIVSKNIIIAVPPQNLPSIYQDSNGNSMLPDNLKEFIDSLTPTVGVSFDFALESKIYNEKSFLYTENPNGYGIFLSNLDDSIVPKHEEIFKAFIPLSPKRYDDKKYVRENIAKARDYIYDLFPKLERNVIFEEVVTHDLVDSTQINTEQYKDARPNPRDSGLKGVYLVGDYINAYGSGGELAYNSVLKAFKQIKEDLGKS
ncbi:MAG: NAD(P)-binding protein, partial [Candidatus Lokiarchaeota archaeon]|nr:NAD(P)-binding protein [Candidatus Lokiarchaeota archaeon]